MSDSKISSLTELTSIATDDEFVIVDKSDTSMAVSGTTKKVKTSSIIDTDGTLAGNLDSKVASQKATKTYADTKLSISSKATAVQAAAGTDDTNYLTSLSAASHMNYGLSRQAIINGNFDVWQRGTSFNNSGTLKYTSDRWVSDNILSTYTVSRQDGTGVNGSRYCLRFSRDNGSTATTNRVIRQGVETSNAVLMRGKKLTLSFYARAGANYSPTSSTLNYIISSGTGSDESPSGYTGGSTIASGASSITTSWQKFTVSTASAVLSSVNEINVTIYDSPTGTAGAADYFEIAQVQLCAGDVALPFNPKSFEEELRACQRYYEKSYNYSVVPGTNTGIDGGIEDFTGSAAAYTIGNVRYRVRKRASVTPTYWDSAGNISKVTAEGTANQAATAVDNFSESGFKIFQISKARVSFHWTAEAEL